MFGHTFKPKISTTIIDNMWNREECSSKGGTSEGSCASGFGVCCIVALSCGGSTSDNNSYIVQSSATSVTSPCTYTVCPCSTDICRIRYDFTVSFTWKILMLQHCDNNFSTDFKLGWPSSEHCKSHRWYFGPRPFNWWLCHWHHDYFIPWKNWFSNHLWI